MAKKPSTLATGLATLTGGDDDYRAKSDADALMRAEEIKGDKGRHAAAQTHVRKQFHTAARAMAKSTAKKPGRNESAGAEKEPGEKRDRKVVKKGGGEPVSNRSDPERDGAQKKGSRYIAENVVRRGDMK